jgi:ribosomal protein S18 acetylase RimI-like enzyme
MTEFHVRRATQDDADCLAPLFDAYRRFYERPSDHGLARDFLKHRLSRNESVVFVAESAGELLGFVQLYPSFDSVEAGPVWILHDLFVNPAARQRGVGRALMEAARRLAAQTGAAGLSLATASDNLVAQRLYESLGYRRDERFFHYFLPIHPERDEKRGR